VEIYQSVEATEWISIKPGTEGGFLYFKLSSEFSFGPYRLNTTPTFDSTYAEFDEVRQKKLNVYFLQLRSLIKWNATGISRLPAETA
jgi:hypothetical protein